MGTGIAQVCAHAGLEVIALDASEEQLAVGHRRLTASLAERVRRGRLTEAERDDALARVRTTTEVSELAAADVVLEAVAEVLDVKLELLSRVAAVVPADCTIATSTSALSVTELARSVPAPERFAGLHFFNPVPLMELVEVVAALQTAPGTVRTLEALAVRIGKHPVVTKDRPGFLLNRVLMPYLNQVIQAYDDGIATAEDIDASLRQGLGHPMGALELLDLIGLDVHEHATEAAYQQTRDAAYSPPPLLSRMVDAGLHGRKTGRGFHDHEAVA